MHRFAPLTDRLIPARLRWLLGDRVNTVIALAATALLTGLCEAAILAIFAETAAALVSGQDTVTIELGPAVVRTGVGTLLAVAVGLALTRIGLGFAQSFLPPRIAGNVQAKLRRELLSSYLGASWAVQAEDREGHLQEVMTNQANQASQAAVAATGMIGAALAFLALIATALLLNPVAVLIVVLMASILFGVLQPLRSTGRRRALDLSGAQMEFANTVSEMNRMAEEAKVFGVTAAQERGVDEYVERARALFIRTQALIRLVPNLYQSVLYLFIVAGLLALYSTSTGQISSLGAVVLLLVRAGTYGQAIQGGYQIVSQATPFIDRIRETSQAYRASSSPAGRRRLGAVSEIAFEDVSFEYRPGAPVLSGVSFEVGAREAVGIVGPSGAGKSSAVQILLRLRQPTAGRYLVNGLPAAEFAPGDWQANVAYVPQEPHLIHASVADNIRFFRDVDEAEVRRAARLAHIDEAIAGWADGYETTIGPRADAVSGGQRQRICLARALAGRPSVLILDEPTSALDPTSEALVRQSLIELQREMTLFVIAHGSALLDACDRVMVLVDGRLEAFDTTSSLAAASASRRKLAGLGLEALGDQVLL